MVGEAVIVGGALMVLLWGVRRWARRRTTDRLHVSQDTIARLRRSKDEGG